MARFQKGHTKAFSDGRPGVADATVFSALIQCLFPGGCHPGATRTEHISEMATLRQGGFAGTLPRSSFFVRPSVRDRA